MNDKSDTQQQQDWLWLAIIAGLGFALRVAAMAYFQHVPESDELVYRSMALNLLGGHGIVDSMGNHAMYNAGYSLFILAPVFFLFGEDLLAVRLVNMFLGVVAIILCYLLAKEAGAGRLGRLIAALAWALYLPNAIYGMYLAK
ncbi:hypothetical protein [Janthinobacterium sp. PAMC25594]|uniref:hypothetical protein n=1 Tax=Janthinobacterium sp. PAMC25594 TaxID=2861284 RepID=UPI002158F402|nr:hypothetical protein [Janthinobacterium sp. PAMC25594]